METLCERDFTLSRINAHAQYWREGDSYGQYLITPRSEHGLMLLAGCNARFVLKDGKAVEGKRGETIYLPRGAQYAVSFSQCTGEGARCLLVNFQLQDAGGEALRLGELAPLDFLRPFECEQELRRTVEAYLAPRYHPGAVKGELYTLLVELSDKKARRRVPGRFEGVEKGRQYLETHWREEISLAALARLCLMSESGFRKRFHEYTGQSPSQYRMSLRIEQAERLLRSAESVTVADVAREVGIEDANYFSRLFHRKTGRTPLEYMRGDLC